MVAGQHTLVNDHFGLEFYLTSSVFKVVWQKSNSPQIRQLILYFHSYEEQVDKFVWELTFAKRL